ncbi:hypothetical protein BJV77DRAFT_103310 [Russula vinacea]|nr:hypothetical protein BJV77DRAFT_103310 [Russula vinacea]
MRPERPISFQTLFKHIPGLRSSSLTARHSPPPQSRLTIDPYNTAGTAAISSPQIYNPTSTRKNQGEGKHIQPIYLLRFVSLPFRSGNPYK